MAATDEVTTSFLTLYLCHASNTDQVPKQNFKIESKYAWKRIKINFQQKSKFMLLSFGILA